MRIALPKGRNLTPTVQAFEEAGLELAGLDSERLSQRLGSGVEVLLLKDWDVPLYVEYGIADCGVVGSDVLAEVGADVLEPLRLLAGRSRFSIIRKDDIEPERGAELRVATKYPEWSRRLLVARGFGPEIFKLYGSVELGPLLDLADIACDIVQTGRTIREHGLFEVTVLAEVAPTLVVNRAAWQALRAPLRELTCGLEAAGVVE